MADGNTVIVFGKAVSNIGAITDVMKFKEAPGAALGLYLDQAAQRELLQEVAALDAFHKSQAQNSAAHSSISIDTSRTGGLASPKTPANTSPAQKGISLK